MTWVQKLLGLEKDGKAMPQSQESIDRRALTDRLIEEHRRANAEAREQLQEEAPRIASRYLVAMDQAMTIIRGG